VTFARANRTSTEPPTTRRAQHGRRSGFAYGTWALIIRSAEVRYHHAIWRTPVRAVLTLACLVISSLGVIAQTRPTPAPGTQKPGMAPRPPLVFSETWKMPPYTGEQTDENTRVTPAALTNANLARNAQGSDAKELR